MLKVCPNQPLCETRWTALRSHYRDDVSNPASQRFSTAIHRLRKGGPSLYDNARLIGCEATAVNGAL